MGPYRRHCSDLTLNRDTGWEVKFPTFVTASRPIKLKLRYVVSLCTTNNSYKFCTIRSNYRVRIKYF